MIKKAMAETPVDNEIAYNYPRAGRLIEFIEALRVPDGALVGQNIVLRPFQKEIINQVYAPVWPDGRRVVRTAVMSIGKKNAKALALDTPIPTPWGWRTMADIHPGDWIFGSDGKRRRVIAESEIFIGKPCYEITFSDGSKIISSEDHLWTTRHTFRPWETPATYSSGKQRGRVGNIHRETLGQVTTAQIADSVRSPLKNGIPTFNHKIDLAPALDMEFKHLPIHPYILGAWLGDGTSADARFTAGEKDLEFFISTFEFPYPGLVKVAKYANRSATIRINGGFQSILRTNKLLNNKHIPEIYFDATETERWTLLQGLMDTDGTVHQCGGFTTARCSLTTKRQNLAYDVWRLARSLGLKATIRESVAKIKERVIGPIWRVSFPAAKNQPVFKLKRKQDLLPETLGKRSGNVSIVSCVKIHSVPCKCIAVDSPDHLYLAGHGCIPTHNTALVAALVLAHLCGPEAVRQGQLYSLAFDREQAAIVYKYAAAMIAMDEELGLAARLNVIDSRKKIVDPVSGSEFTALSGEKKGKHGKSASFIAFDELADFGTDGALYDALMTARGAHINSLAWVFSTQSPDDKAILSELIDYGVRVQEDGSDPSFKLFLWQTPADLDPWEEANWYLANPALGDFKSLESMRDEAQKAQNMPSREASFRNLHLNQRIDATAHFITPDLWKGCGGVPELAGAEERTWWGGLDLSGKNDLTSLVLVSQAPDGIWEVLPWFWVPGDNLRQKQDRDRAPYTVWRDKGHLIAKPGKVIDYAWVAQRLGELLEEFKIAAIKFDRWRINDLRREFDSLGIETWIMGEDWKEGDRGVQPAGLCLIPHGQGFKDMNPAVEILEDLLTDKKLRHGMHPVLTWCVSNTRVQSDPAGGRKFDKIKSTGRIDGTVALAMALNGATTQAEDTVSVYESRGVIAI